VWDISAAWSTAHLRANTSTIRQAEAGYNEGTGAGGNHAFNWFWEGQIGNTLYGDRYSGPCCQSSGIDVRFKVAGVQGTNDWTFWYKIGSAGFVQFSPSNSCTCLSLGFSAGTPNGETSRKGDPETRGTDHQFDLSYRPNNYGSWTSWQDYRGQACRNVCIPGYHYTYTPGTTNDYRIEPN
jgi:hypothetical protein